MRIQKDGPSPGVHAESSEYDVIAGSYDPPGLSSQTARRQLLREAVESAVISGICRARSMRVKRTIIHLINTSREFASAFAFSDFHIP